jgi:hypothetical protein
MTYKIENCPMCKGTHFGSYECPIFCICCASGNDLPNGEYCRACGRRSSPITQAQSSPVENTDVSQSFK